MGHIRGSGDAGCVVALAWVRPIQHFERGNVLNFDSNEMIIGSGSSNSIISITFICINIDLFLFILFIYVFCVYCVFSIYIVLMVLVVMV